MDLSHGRCGRLGVNLSLGEFRALVAKAFRGAGYSWGLTEDAAFASMRLAEFGLEAGPVVARLLEATQGFVTTQLMPSETWECEGALLCPVCVGTSLVDVGECAEVSLDRVAEPILLAPFLLSLIEPGGDGFVIAWDGGRCEVGIDSITQSGSAADDLQTVVITRQRVNRTASTRQSRVELDMATQTAIEAFAHRTYAPATEASRRAGAGASRDDD